MADPTSPIGSKSAKFGLEFVVSEGGQTNWIGLHEDVTATWDKDSLVLEVTMFGYQAEQLRDKLDALLHSFEQAES